MFKLFMSKNKKRATKIAQSMLNDKKYMFLLDDFYPDHIDIIQNIDRDELFNGMLEEVNTFEIRRDLKLSTKMIEDIFDIMDNLIQQK